MDPHLPNDPLRVTETPAPPARDRHSRDRAATAAGERRGGTGAGGAAAGGAAGANAVRGRQAVPGLMQAASPMRQIPLGLELDEEPGFDSFFAGPNAEVVGHLRGLSLDAPPTPLYLWGEAGCGKTHLLRALAQQMQAQGAQVGWFDAGTPPPWSFHEGWRLLVLDDCGAFDAVQQQAAFALFIEATTQGTMVAGAGPLPPVDLPLRDDLRSRLGWGHVFHVLPLDEGDCRAVLRREADRRGIFLSDEVMTYLLTRFARDLGSLMELLERLDRFALAEKRSVSVPLLKRMLAEEGSA